MREDYSTFKAGDRTAVLASRPNVSQKRFQKKNGEHFRLAHDHNNQVLIQNFEVELPLLFLLFSDSSRLGFRFVAVVSMAENDPLFRSSKFLLMLFSVEIRKLFALLSCLDALLEFECSPD